MSRYLLESVLVALGPLAAAGFLSVWYVRRYGWTSRASGSSLGWTVPPVLVYTLVHFGQAGYVLTFLPALVIFLSRVLVTALGHAGELAAPSARARRARDRRGGRARRARQRLVLRVARPTPARLRHDREPPGSDEAQDEAFDWIFSRTAAALREHEEVVRRFVDSIRGLYPREDDRRSSPSRAIHARTRGTRHAMFYLPEYAVYELQVGDLPPGYDASAAARSTMTTTPETVRSACRRRSSGSSGSSTTGARRPCGRRASSRSRFPTAAICTCCRSARSPSTYADYTFVRDEPPRRAVGAARPDRGSGSRAESSGGAMTSSSSPPRCLPLALFAARERLIAGAPGFPARRLVDSSALRAQPRRGRRLLVSTRATGRRLDGAALDAAARRASPPCSAASLWTAKVLGIIVTAGRRPPRPAARRSPGGLSPTSALAAAVGAHCGWAPSSGARSRAWRSRSPPSWWPRRSSRTRAIAPLATAAVRGAGGPRASRGAAARSVLRRGAPADAPSGRTVHRGNRP